MRITFALVLGTCVGLAAPAVALPAAGLGSTTSVGPKSLIEKAEFVRLRDGTIEYRRPRFDDRGPYFFAYRGYAYPYNPGYTYRLYRGKLRPSDRLRRYKIAD